MYQRNRGSHLESQGGPCAAVALKHLPRGVPINHFDDKTRARISRELEACTTFTRETPSGLFQCLGRGCQMFVTVDHRGQIEQDPGSGCAAYRQTESFRPYKPPAQDESPTPPPTEEIIPPAPSDTPALTFTLADRIGVRD